MGTVTPETCRVTLQWINICILLHLVGFLLTLNYDARNHELKKNTKRTLDKTIKTGKSGSIANFRYVVALLRIVQTWIQFCARCQHNCRPIRWWRISWKSEYGKPYFATGEHKITFVKLHTFCTTWVKFFISNLHLVLFNILMYVKLGQGRVHCPY